MDDLELCSHTISGKDWISVLLHRMRRVESVDGDRRVIANTGWLKVVDIMRNLFLDFARGDCFLPEWEIEFNSPPDMKIMFSGRKCVAVSSFSVRADMVALFNFLVEKNIGFQVW